MENRIKFYSERVESSKNELIKIKQSYNTISILRLVTILSAIAFTYYCYKKGAFVFAIILLVLHIALFIALAQIHEKISIKKRNTEEFININEREKQRIDGQWRQFEDKGIEYLDVKHPFINDLDIFGQNSLFQWINETKTKYGREYLSKLLVMKKVLERKEILKRQEALKELSNNIEFRQKVLISLKARKKNKVEEDFLINWINEENKHMISTQITILRIVMPIINILVVILSFVNVLPWPMIILSLGISSIILSKIGKEVKEGLLIFEELKYKISTYVNAIKIIEDEKFSTSKLIDLQKKFKYSGKYASDKLKDLEDITTWLYDRGNAFYIIFNCLFLWDYQMVYRLEKWRNKNKNDFSLWMESLGEFEALISLSTLIFNNPNWCTPEISEANMMLGENIIHPMLLENGVGNSFIMNENNRVLLITGSNMSGKSTFLRTVGFNVILSYLGLTINGEKFVTPILNVYTCMRTGDNLEESISSFYAEILRIKNIVDGTKKSEKILFLLDEIFKGTNSMDRHLGAKVLIEQLLQGNTLGLVSTHDLELCEMEENNKEIINYNFREYYEDNKLKFDYKLRKGVSKTRNAKYLMRMAGIDIQ